MRFLGLSFSTVAIFALCFLSSACDGSKHSPPPNAEPLLWLNENELLVGDTSAVRVYDSSNGKIIRTAYEADKERGKLIFLSSCVSKDRWILRQIKEVTDGKGGHSSQDRWLSIIWVNSTNSTVEFFDRPRAVNRFDCQASEAFEPTPASIIVQGLEHRRINQTPLVSSNEADRFTLYGHGVSLVAVAHKNGTVRRLEFEAKLSRLGEDIQASYDAQTGLYFWYSTTRDFQENKIRPNWPLRGWWIDSSLTIRSSTDLPAGPWVGAYGTLKSLSCGGCGCACFSHIRFYSANGRVFAFVWGRGIIEGQAGIYELVAPSSSTANWKRIAAEPAEQLNSAAVFSPSGCKLAYYSATLKILNVCSNKS